MSYDNLSSVSQNVLIFYSNVQLCAFKHRNSPFEIFFTKYGFDIGPSPNIVTNMFWLN